MAGVAGSLPRHFAFYPTVGASVWVAAVLPATTRWPGRIVAAPDEDDTGCWLVQRQDEESGEYRSRERVGWDMLAPRDYQAGAVQRQEPPPAVAEPSATDQSTAGAAAADNRDGDSAADSPATARHRGFAARQAAVLPPTMPLPTPERGFTIASFNMLISQWFSAKYYHHSVSAATREWPARGKLMQDMLGCMAPDVLCIQEGNAQTFDVEFGFMHGLGYDVVKYSKPFRMPMFTFFRTERLELLREKSANRTVITIFRERAAAGTFAVVNCHLSAGDSGGAPRKRLQQVVDGLETARKELAKAAAAAATTTKQPPPQPKKKKNAAATLPPEGAVCVVGDFNSDATDPQYNSVVAHFLQTGEVKPEFREDAAGAALTSKTKRHRWFGGLRDAYADAFAAVGERRPPTYIAAALIPKFVGRGDTVRRVYIPYTLYPTVP